MTKKIIAPLLILLLAACMTSGPQKALDQTAKAMDDNNPAAFLANFDLKIFANNHLNNLTNNDAALSSLNALGNALGLGSIDNLINSFVDVQAQIRGDFEMGVASGELMAKCRTSNTPDCPWVPESLRNAAIVELGPDAAVAKVTTPAKLTSWLALHKFGEKWLIVGQAVMESQASQYATNANAKISPKTPTKPAPQQKPAPGQKPASGQKPATTQI